MNIKIICFSFVLFSLIYCSLVEKAKNHKEISNTHRKIAFLPPIVNIEIKVFTELKLIKEQEKWELVRFQKSLVDYLNSKALEGDFFVTIQPETETNQILSENNIKSMTNKSYQDLAKLPNVDTVITSRVSLANPMTKA